jgi:Xaa-Pro aminopeptidase
VGAAEKKEKLGVMQNHHSARLRSVRSFLGPNGKLVKLGKDPSDAFILVCQDGAGWEDIYYLTGFIGSSGVVLITEDAATLFVDPRYSRAARERSCCNVVCCEDVKRLSPLQAALDYLSGKKPRRIAYGGKRMRHSAYQYMERALYNMGHAVELLDLSNLISNLRRRKNKAEIESISDAAAIASKAFIETLSSAGVGMSEREFAGRLDCLIKAGGGDFMDQVPLMVSSGERTSMPHALPTDKKFERGDLVMVDFSVRRAGYVCDITRMFSLGEPSNEAKILYAVLQWAQAEAADLLKPRTPASAVDAAARRAIDGAGVGDLFLHGVGHGIGLCIHEPPSLNASSKAVLSEGDVVTLEPGFYKPGWGGMRLEDDYLIGRDKPSKLSEALGNELFVV